MSDLLSICIYDGCSVRLYFRALRFCCCCCSLVTEYCTSITSGFSVDAVFLPPSSSTDKSNSSTVCDPSRLNNNRVSRTESDAPLPSAATLSNAISSSAARPVRTLVTSAVTVPDTRPSTTRACCDTTTTSTSSSAAASPSTARTRRWCRAAVSARSNVADSGDSRGDDSEDRTDDHADEEEEVEEEEERREESRDEKGEEAADEDEEDEDGKGKGKGKGDDGADEDAAREEKGEAGDVEERVDQR